MNYKSKYLKYKLKYLITKKLLGGSNSDRPKSAPTTLYEKKLVAGPNTTGYDDPEDKERGHHGDSRDIRDELLAERMAQDYQHEISKPDNKSIKN